MFFDIGDDFRAADSGLPEIAADECPAWPGVRQREENIKAVAGETDEFGARRRYLG